ncbi:MAG: YfhO family protein, partial [Candidatus Binatia bacterium]
MTKPGRRLAAAAALFLLGWIVVPFWSLATLRSVNVQDDIYTSDLLNDRLPARAFVGRSLREGEAPWWMPGIYTGLPALAAVEVAVLYPSNLLLFGAFDPYTAIAWAQLLPLFIAGFGAFLLAREYRLPPEAALLVAGSFSLCGFFVCHLRQLNMVDAACWIPLLYFLVERRLRGAPRPGLAALAAVWALQLLAGHPQISYVTALGVGVLLVVRWRQLDRERQPAAGALAWPIRLLGDPALREVALGVGVGTLVAAAQLLPGLELSRLSHRGGGFSLEEAARYPAPPRSFWTFFLPYVNGDPGRDSYRLPGIFWEQYGYLGLAPALLALFALVAGWRNGKVRLFGAMSLLSYLLVLGPATPLLRLAHAWFPGMAYFRFPTRFLVLVDLGLALLAGFGLAIVLARVRSQRLRAAIAAAVLVVTAIDLWVHQMRQVPLVDRSAWTSPIPTADWLRERVAAPDGPWRYYSLDSTVVHTATFHEAGGWSGDLSPYLRLRSLLQPSFNLLHGFDSPDGYVNLAPRYYEAVWGSDKEPGLVRPSGAAGDDGWRLDPAVALLLRMFNVRYVIAAYPVVSAALRPPVVFPEGFGVQEVVDPLPRAFVVGEAIPVRSDGEALARLRSAALDPERQALVHGAVDLPADAAPSRDVRITQRSHVRMRLEARLERPGLLVVSEGWYPGWEATVDGRKAPLLRANMMMRAVTLPAGEHVVELRFRSPAIRQGFL